MSNNKKYWKGLEELNQEPAFVEAAQNEFPEFLSVKDGSENENSNATNRRDFLKLMGFSVAAASLAACETPVKKVIPYINKPENVDPGLANYYSSTYAQNGNYCSVVVKTREGRPIKIEGNPDSSISQGGVNTQATASILSLYDSSRLKNFTKKGEAISKVDADKEIVKALKGLKSGAKVRIVSETILSPSTKAIISDFAKKYNTLDVQPVIYDPVSATGILKANGGVIPNYDFSKANVIASFSADFLGTWISPIEFTKQYSKNRKVSKSKKVMSKHYQVESTFSLTGANADERFAVKPSEEPHYIIALYNAIAAKAGASSISGKAVDAKAVKAIANDLWANKGKSLVVSGSNDEAVQLLVKEINKMIGAEGATINVDQPAYFKQGNDDAMASFLEDLAAGKVDAVIFNGANPVYDHPKGADIATALSKVALTVSFSDRVEETSSLCTYICPGLHYLESWGDAEPKKGILSLSQPTITPIFNNPVKGWENRAVQESLLTWAGETKSYYDYLQNFWKENFFPASGEASFEKFWNKSVQLGISEVKVASSEPAEVVIVENNEEAAEESEAAPVVDNSSLFAYKVQFNDAESVAKAVKKINKVYVAPASADTLELSIYESVSLGNGAQANNPWLHESPDPISKVTWDNYLSVSKSDAEARGWTVSEPGEFPIVKIITPRGALKAAVLIQPGQAKGTASIALGYGRTQTGTLTSNETKANRIKNANGEKAIGVNAYPLVSVVNSTLSYVSFDAKFKLASKTHRLAQTQTHHTIMGRDTAGGETIIQEATLAQYKQGETGVIKKKISTTDGKLDPNQVDLWAAPQYEKDENGRIKKDEHGNPIYAETKVHEYNNHHWGLVVDLNACTGCGACHVSCQVENNIPVVGKDEVLRRREMHWMRIDRYYSSDEPSTNKTISGYKKMEEPSDNPKVIFQPMMCQHCNHAPCETVCPVAATTHSTEGLNQMTYNRCIGTRYCANNCPYKVRRFNWFNYSDSLDDGREFMHVNQMMNDDLGKMVLNPDVVVRARGTMEKCSMCVQRIQAGKLQAKIEGRRPQDGEIVTACQSVCPADAITFGDMNDKNSEISKILTEENEDRSYHVLDELNVKPSVSYLSKIRNI